MNGWVEFGGFLGLATAAHLMIWQVAPSGAVQSAGQAGDETISLVGANPALQALVAEWDTGPAVATAPQMPTTPPMDTTPPVAPESAMTPTVPAPVVATATPDTLPSVDLSTPTLVSPMAPLVAARPPERPANLVPAPPPRQATARTTSRPRATAPAASGSGNSSAPAISPPPAAPTARGPDPAMMSRWGSAIRASIERNKRYPADSRATGTVSLSIAVSTGGTLNGVGISRSSGDAALDRAAIDAVSRARIPAAPAGMAGGSHQFTLSVSFER